MRINTILGCILLAWACTQPAVAAENTNKIEACGRPQSVGLVLSGGGAKGVAHIGVIKALEDADIPIDYITGTSAGAIVGGLYACGYTTDEMLNMFLSPEFAYWSTGRTDPKMKYYFDLDEPTPALMHLPIARNDSAANAQAVPASLINPLPMNFAFMELFAAYTAQCGGNFDNLFVPFRCCASDVAANHKVVHRSGQLGDAIRTSMSFPIVFQPIKMNGALLYDGGIFDNFPVDVMTQDFAPDIMIGVDVSTAEVGPQTSIMDQIDNLVMRPQSYDLDPERGIKIRVDLNQFGLLDFPAARQIYQVGYDKAMTMIDSIKGRVTSRTPHLARATARGVFKSRTPYIAFDSVHVTGASERQREYIEYLFEPAHADTFGIDRARQSYYRSISADQLRDLFPTAVYNDTTGRFTLNLHATSRDEFKIGIGAYLTSSTSSYLFVSGAYRSMRFASVSASLKGWLGQSYMAGQLQSSVRMPSTIPSALTLNVVGSRQRFFETDHLFYDESMPTFIIDREIYGRLGYEMAAGSRGKWSLNVGMGHLCSSFYRSTQKLSYTLRRDRTWFNPGQIRLSYDASTLDDMNYPTAGALYQFTAMGVLGKFGFESPDNQSPAESFTNKWVQLELRSRNFFDLSSHFSFGIEADAMLSTRKLPNDYNAAMVCAPSYDPTPSSYNAFNPAFRANSFIGAGIVPVYKYSSSLSARLALHGFIPVRPIVCVDGWRADYDGWFKHPEFFGEASVSYAFPFATLSGYVNYASSVTGKHWNAGISFGVFILAPKYLR